MNLKIIFFGSTSDSVLILEKLFNFRLPPAFRRGRTFDFRLISVVTQPPRPVGRNRVLTPTPVEDWARKQRVTVLSFPSSPQKPWLYENEETVIETLAPIKADLLISACYGQKIPIAVINKACFGGLNVHPSILPRWRGADPVPWAILTDDRQIGVTIVRLSTKFDQGVIFAQEKLNITEEDTTDQLRSKLFTMGADLLRKNLPDILCGKLKGSPQKTEGTAPYARRLTRDDGFEPWGIIQKTYADPTEAARIYRKFRAFSPWPGVWTEIETRDKRQGTGKTKKRLKIISCHLQPTTNNLQLDLVQLEGKKPTSFRQFSTAYLPNDDIPNNTP
ncbi:methionyl-tRNA formyltransferase [Patescibacteria group bacterium]|nr:methionyl-tRNA formyltransferase [Patescibacteria group bacterium]MBU1472610.1 methionyl-tRNA formyltransferase [Patescibacteria group bacterium]MBU2459861.1 methionyl-tRNA formyltransferase [Patescibacteria group bacterium]MBU2544078.1 methionyl-tRNA formyltransferase [Patescibacteria group bacterium]